MNERILKFYLRKDIQKEILFASKDREVVPKYNDSFGKRPDILQFESDVSELAKQGTTSFHISEEHWKNPLELMSGMTKRQLDNFRTGFDFILDIDCPFFEYSKQCTDLIIEVIKSHNIKNIGIKFSGNRSFHIGLPFESFPKKINNIETRLLFPDVPRAIASYLKELIKERLAERILSLNTIEEISKAVGKKQEELIENKNFNAFSILSIDTVLISSRHLYRSPYSINEKSNLVSLPLKLNSLKKFKINNAKIENVEAGTKFINKCEENEAIQLIVQAFDWQNKSRDEIKSDNIVFKTEKKIAKDFFPPCMKLILNGMSSDGRKRALFILINFLKNTNYPIEEIETIISKWNKENYEPLKEGYIKAQLSWHKRQKQNILPPNCDNKAYYIDIGVCKPDELCSKIKNPVQYAIKKSRQRIYQKIK